MINPSLSESVLRLIVPLLVMCTAIKSNAQSPDSLFIITYSTGDAWDESKPAIEQLHFKEHSVRLGQYRKEGTIKFGARYGDKGIIVVAFPNRQGAFQWLNNDPAIKNRLFIAILEPLNIFYPGCLEKPN